DINECKEGTHNCSSNAVCNNTKGSYNCTCKPGYEGDGNNCTGNFFLNLVIFLPLFNMISDINECNAGTHNCSSNAFCNNTKGSYNCSCKPGYTGDGWTCTGK
ncbi:unnamed protein product, partial [Porites evermanni]